MDFDHIHPSLISSLHIFEGTKYISNKLAVKISMVCLMCVLLWFMSHSLVLLNLQPYVRILYEKFFACPEAKGLFQISSTECPMQGRLRVLDINLVYIKKIKRVPRQGTNSPGWLFWKSGSSCGGQMCYMLMQNLHTVK